MSVQWTAKAWEIDGISPLEKLVLLNLADYANKDTGLAWPSLTTIARQCCCTEKTVRNNIKTLREKGLIAYKSTSGRVNCYEIKPWKEVPGSNPVNSYQGPRNLLPPTLVTDSTEPLRTITEPVPPKPPEGEAGWRLRLCSVFGHRDARLHDRKLNRSWQNAMATGEMTEEAVAGVEWWYSFQMKATAAQPKKYWCRASLVTLLNNWVDDVAFIRSRRDPEVDDRPAWEKGELIETGN